MVKQAWATSAGFLADQFALVSPHLEDGGVLTLAMGWQHSREILTSVSANDIELLNVCVWNKTNGRMGSLYRSQYELFRVAERGNLTMPLQRFPARSYNALFPQLSNLVGTNSQSCEDFVSVLTQHWRRRKAFR